MLYQNGEEFRCTYLCLFRAFQQHLSTFSNFFHDNIFAKHRTKMTTVSSFPRQNDAGLRALDAVL